MKCVEKCAPGVSSSERNSATAVLTQPSMGLRVEMDFQHRYYKTNKVLLSAIGQWPYQTTRARRGFTVTLLSVTTGHIVAEIMAGLKYRDDSKVLLECASLFIFIATCFAKTIASAWNSQKMLKLLNRIRTDWQTWSREEEVDILHRYADQGRRMTIVYAVTIYSNGTLFMAQPVVPKVIDLLLRNGSEPGEFPVAVEYHRLDMQKYYFYIVTYSYVCGCVAMLVTVALDAAFIVYVQHCCGIFAALGHKLERIGKNRGAAEMGESAYALDERDTDFEHLVSCIGRHRDAIEYAELIEETYSWYFFFMMGLHMFIISVTGLQIFKKTNEPQETIKFVVWLLVYIMRLYIESHMCQILMDHSITVRYHIHNGEWYSLSLKARKLIPLMLMRCNVPCKLTAGRIGIMSMKTFRAFLKASMSYFTLLRSM